MYMMYSVYSYLKASRLGVDLQHVENLIIVLREV